MEEPRIAQPLSQKSTVPLLPLQGLSVRDLSSVLLLRLIFLTPFQYCLAPNLSLRRFL